MIAVVLLAALRALFMLVVVKFLKWSTLWDRVCVPAVDLVLWLPRRAYRLVSWAVTPCLPCCGWLVHLIGRLWLALFAAQAASLIYLWQRDRDYLCPPCGGGGEAAAITMKR